MDNSVSIHPASQATAQIARYSQWQLCDEEFPGSLGLSPGILKQYNLHIEWT